MSIAEFPNNSNRTRNSAAEFERTPPQDVIAEQSVLGGMLLSKDAISDVVEILRERDFYRPAHELIYDAIVDLYGRGEPADPVTVSAELTKRGDLVRAGGAPYLHTLISSVCSAHIPIPLISRSGLYLLVAGAPHFIQVMILYLGYHHLKSPGSYL